MRAKFNSRGFVFLYFQSEKCGFLSTARDFATIEKLLRMEPGDLILLLDLILVTYILTEKIANAACASGVFFKFDIS